MSFLFCNKRTFKQLVFDLIKEEWILKVKEDLLDLDIPYTFDFIRNKSKQAGAELGQAQVMLDDIVEVVIEVVVKAV